jgi:hypothetical protein
MTTLSTPKTLASRSWLCLLLFSAGCLALVGCQRDESAPQRRFVLIDLFPEVSSFPEDWLFEGIDDYVILTYGAEESFDMVFHYGPNETEGTRGGITVYRQTSLKEADRQFLEEAGIEFDSDSRWDTTPTFTPEGLADLAISAAQSRVGCRGQTSEGLWNDTVYCKYLAQYEEFVVYFRIDIMHDGEMTISMEEIRQIIIAIDERITSQLAADALQPED